MRRQVIVVHRPGHPHRTRVKPQVAAHHADAVIAVPGKIAEGGVDVSKQARLDQLQLDLFQRAAVELLGDLDLQPTFGGGADDGISLAQAVRDRRLEQNIHAASTAINPTSPLAW